MLSSLKVTMMRGTLDYCERHKVKFFLINQRKRPLMLNCFSVRWSKS